MALLIRDEAVEKSQDKIADMKCFQLWRLIGAKDDLSWEQVCQAVCGDCRYKTSEEGACTELIAIAILDAIRWEEMAEKLSQWQSYKKELIEQVDAVSKRAKGVTDLLRVTP